jgi:hypothetical protein
MKSARPVSAARVAQGGGSLSPKTAKLVRAATKRGKKSVAAIKQKRSG